LHLPLIEESWEKAIAGDKNSRTVITSVCLFIL